MFVPQGYRYAVRLTVTNASASTMGGSTSAPQTSPTDYVVQLHLPGDSTLAAQILATATDQTTFNDVTVWYGSTQLDIDDDTTAHGAWNSTNGLTLSFKLQASIAAGAIDTNDILAWGSVNTSPSAQRNLANVYPFADDFTADGGSLDTMQRWTVSSGPAPVVSFDPTTHWLKLTTPSGTAVGYASIQLQTSFGAGYRVTMYGTQPQPTTPKTLIGNGLANRSGLGTPFAETYTSNGAVSVAEKNGGSAQTTTLSGTPDGNHHFFEVWRDPNSTPAGLAHGWLDGTSVQVGTGQESTTAEPVQLFVWSSALGDTQQVSLTAQFVKVRAWNGTEAIVSAGYAYVPVGYQYAQRLSVTNPSTSLAMPGSTTTPVPTTGTAQSYTPPTGVTYTKINGTQDPSTNNRHSYNSTNAPPYNAITIRSFDAVLVSRS